MVKTVYLYGFPTVVSSEAVTKFLEEYTGEGTVLSVNVLPPKHRGSRSSAKVQFTTAECAEIILALADDKRLRYGKSYLQKAREWKGHIAPRSTVLEERVRLHFGCKISEEKFSVLWTKSDVSVKFGKDLNDVHLGFSFDCVEYKLELPSDTICRIELHCPCDQFEKFLLIQLRGAPRIYKKDVTVKNHWVREVDFAPSCCIGQSSSLCLELPFECSLPDLNKSCVQYIENEGQFGLKEGNTFSGSSALVPILAPPPTNPPTTNAPVNTTTLTVTNTTTANFLTIKLDRNNYSLWLAQITPLLKSKNLMGFVNGTKPCPPAFLRSASGELTDAINPAYEEWMANDQMILGWINGSLTPSVLSIVSRSISSHTTWASLSRRYASPNHNRILELRGTLLRTTRGDLSIPDYLDKINQDQPTTLEGPIANGFDPINNGPSSNKSSLFTTLSATSVAADV